MITLISLPIANGQTVQELIGGQSGVLEVSLQAISPPSAGTLQIEGQLYASSTWLQIQNAQALSLAALASGGDLFATDYGHFARLRFTLSGVVGGSGVILGAAGFASANGFPDAAFSGFRALNTQSYVESNVKLGVQYYIQYQLPTIAGGGTNQHKIAFNTGAKPVLVKSRDLYGLGNSIAMQVFKQPTGVSGGTPITVQNFNDINPVATSVSVQGGVTATGNGTSWGDPTHIYGANTAGNRFGSGLAPGGDRVLKPNSSYLVVVSNLDTTAGASGNALCDYFLTWYEGQPDLPR